MPDLASVPRKLETIPVTLSIRQRTGLDAYLASFASGKSARIAGQCRMALNCRAVTLGLAKDPEEVVFVPEEIEFLRGQLESTRDAMIGLLSALGVS